VRSYLASYDSAEAASALNTARLADLMVYAIPLSILPALGVTVLLRSFGGLIVTLELAIIVVVVRHYYKQSPQMQTKGTTSRGYTLPELIVSMSAFIALLLRVPESQPILYYSLIAVGYSLLLLEIISGRATILAFLLKLLFLQVLFVGAFPSMFVSVFSVDPSRDLQIAKSILSNGGGLPEKFTAIVWYNFSPMTALNYALGSVISRLPLIFSELLDGFVVVFLAMLTVGAMTIRVTKNRSATLLAMWIASLSPLLWLYSTNPIPEVLAISLLLLILLVVVQSDSRNILVALPLLATMVLTHGGAPLELALFLGLVWIFTRKKAALRIVILMSVLFGAYLVYVSVAGTEPGIQTLYQFISALATIGSAQITSIPTVTAGGTLGLAFVSLQDIASTYWWVFLAVLSWVGTAEILRRGIGGRTIYVVILTCMVLFGFGVLSSFTGIAANPSLRSQGIRYVSLVSYVVLSLPASVAVMRLFSNRKGRSAITILSMLLLVSAMGNATVAPSIWQSLGQSAYAGGGFAHTTNVAEMQSQAYLDKLDTCYPVMANFIPQFINLTTTCADARQQSLDSESIVGSVGAVSRFEIIRPPYIVLFSQRYNIIGTLYSAANPLANETAPDTDRIYSSASVYATYVG